MMCELGKISSVNVGIKLPTNRRAYQRRCCPFKTILSLKEGIITRKRKRRISTLFRSAQGCHLVCPVLDCCEDCIVLVAGQADGLSSKREGIGLAIWIAALQLAGV